MTFQERAWCTVNVTGVRIDHLFKSALSLAFHSHLHLDFSKVAFAWAEHTGRFGEAANLAQHIPCEYSCRTSQSSPQKPSPRRPGEDTLGLMFYWKRQACSGAESPGNQVPWFVGKLGVLSRLKFLTSSPRFLSSLLRIAHIVLCGPSSHLHTCKMRVNSEVLQSSVYVLSNEREPLAITFLKILFLSYHLHSPRVDPPCRVPGRMTLVMI